MKKPSAPKDLGTAGRALWAWLRENTEGEGTEPLEMELCQLADRLEQTRAALKAAGITTDPKTISMMNVEVRLLGQFRSVWKCLGLADDTTPRAPVGRPVESDRRR